VDIKGGGFSAINKLYHEALDALDELIKRTKPETKRWYYLSSIHEDKTNKSNEFEKNLNIGLVFPPIQKSWKSFHLRALPADQSDWICPNIQLPR